MNTPIHIAPLEPVMGTGTYESPVRVTDLTPVLKDQGHYVLRAAEYNLTGRVDYFNHITIEGHGATINVTPPPHTNICGAIRCDTCRVEDLTIRGTYDREDTFVKEAIFARQGAILKNINIFGLRSNLDKGIESFGVLANGTGFVDIENVRVYSTDPYSVGIYVGQINPARHTSVRRCSVNGARIAYAVNHNVILDQCEGSDNSYAIYNDTDSVWDVRALHCKFTSIKYAAVALNNPHWAEHVRITDSTFEYYNQQGIFLEATTPHLSNIRLQNNEIFCNKHITLLSTLTVPTELAVLDNLVTAPTVRHNIRRAAADTASQSNLSKLLFRGNYQQNGTLLTINKLITSNGEKE